MKKRKTTSKKKIIAGVLVAALLIAGMATFAAVKRHNATVGQNDLADGRTGIQYEEATEEEKAEADANKQKVVEQMEQESQTPTPNPGTKSVTPVIANWAQNQQTHAVEVSAFIPGIYEDGGTCTLTLTKGASQAQATRTAIKNVSDTTCGTISIPASQVSSGAWTATVTYTSAAANGTSSEMSINIQ